MHGPRLGLTPLLLLSLQLWVTCARPLPGRSGAESESKTFRPNLQTRELHPGRSPEWSPAGPHTSPRFGKTAETPRDDAQSACPRATHRPRPTCPHAAPATLDASHLAARCIRQSARPTRL